MLDSATVARLRRHWDEGWNKADLATIVAPFAADIVFSSPFIGRRTGDPTNTTLSGYDAVRSYLAESLRDHSDIRYSIGAVHVGNDTLVLVYTCHLPDGTDLAGADSMRVDAAGKVAEWRCHYPEGSLS